MPPLQPKILRSSHIGACDGCSSRLGGVARNLEGAIHLKTCDIPPWELAGLKNPIWSCLPEGKVEMPPVPEELAMALNTATSPKQIARILARGRNESPTCASLLWKITCPATLQIFSFQMSCKRRRFRTRSCMVPLQMAQWIMSGSSLMEQTTT